MIDIKDRILIGETVQIQLEFEEWGKLDNLGKNLFIKQQQLKLNPYLMQSLGIEPSFFGGMQALPQYCVILNLTCLLKSKLTIVLYFASFVKINNVSYLSVSTQLGISIKCCFQTC